MKVKEGEYIGKAPIGYLNVRDKRGKADVIIDTEKAHIVRQLFEMYSTDDYSMAEARSLITEAGLRSKKNYQKNILQNKDFLSENK